MADEKKAKKTKKKDKKEDEVPESGADAAELPVVEVTETPPSTVEVVEEQPTRASRGSRKAQRTGSNVYAVFSQKQISEFKEAFQMMDEDKDGIISKADLRATFNAIGKGVDEGELNEMLSEAPGALNFTTLLTLFASRMSGSADDDDVVINAFKCFDEKGKIDSEKLRFQLMTFGDRFSEEEVDDAFDQMVMDGMGRIDTSRLIAMLTAREEDEEE